MQQKPIFKHDCHFCVYCGQIDFRGDTFDVYECDDQLTIRYGDLGEEYYSLTFRMAHMVARTDPTSYWALAVQQHTYSLMMHRAALIQYALNDLGRKR